MHSLSLYSSPPIELPQLSRVDGSVARSGAFFSPPAAEISGHTIGLELSYQVWRGKGRRRRRPAILRQTYTNGEIDSTFSPSVPFSSATIQL